jgi:hypothetical protein
MQSARLSRTSRDVEPRAAVSKWSDYFLVIFKGQHQKLKRANPCIAPQYDTICPCICLRVNPFKLPTLWNAKRPTLNKSKMRSSSYRQFCWFREDGQGPTITGSHNTIKDNNPATV